MMRIWEKHNRLILNAAAVLFCAAILVVAKGYDGVAWADPVSVRVSNHDGFARITFDWPRAVPFTARIKGRRLVVQFARPVDSDFAGVPGRIGKYIGRPTISNRRRTITFPLRGKFDLNYSQRGSIVRVDIVTITPPARARRLAPKSPPGKAGSSAAAGGGVGEQVDVRTGKHENFGRVVFDWDRRVSYTLRKKGNRAYITFKRPALIRIAALNRNLLKNVSGATSRAGPKQTMVTLKVPSSSRVRHFADGTKIVIDIYNPAGPNDAKLAANSPPPKLSPPSPSPKLASPAPSPAPSTSNSTSKSKPAKPAKTNLQVIRKPKSLTPVQITKLTPPPAENSTPSPEITTPPAPTDFAPSPFRLRIEWTEPVGAAVFRRAGQLWIVFDGVKNIDLKKIKAAGGRAFRLVEHIPSSRGTILRFITAPGFNPTIGRDGLSWIFDFHKQPLAAQTPINVLSQPGSPAGPRIFLAVAQAGNAIPLKDSEAGDNIVVVPVIPLAHGIEGPHVFQQLKLLTTGQGIAIKPWIDDLRVRSISQGVELSSAGNLALSPLNPKMAANSKIGSINRLSYIFKPDSWRTARRLKSLRQFNNKRREILLAVTEAKPKNKSAARLKYAQFLVANGYDYEAIGVLRTMFGDDPEITANNQYLVLRGAANYMMNRLAEASEDLNQEQLDENDEVEFWRAIVLAGENKAAEAAPILKLKGNIFRSYPRSLKMKLGMVIANAGIAVGDIEFAAKYLEILKAEKPTNNESDQLALIEGHLRLISGDFEGAVVAWEEVENGKHRPSVAHATVARAELLLRQKKITPKEAIEELEKLRFSWRGGDFEFNLLRRLGRLYLDSDNYRSGLRTLKQAASYFRGHPGAKKVTEEMAGAFVDLYLKDAADTMPPVRAIALFDEFKELTPTGEKGDEMIRKLADRLAAVDLLDRAAELLSQQVNFRLKGAQKARVGAQLATVYLVNRQPGRAIKALNKSAVNGLAPELVDQRRHLRARGLIDQNRQAEAIKLIEEDQTLGAEKLRTEVFWKEQDWPNAAQSLQRMVRASGAEPGKGLDDRQAQTVLNFGVALAMSGNDRGMGQLRRDFTAGMNASPFKDAFNLIVSPNSVGLVDYRNLAKKVATVTNFKDFMVVYKERLKAGKLSSLN